MKKVKTIKRYTTREAFDYAYKKLYGISFSKKEMSRVKKMNGKKIKVVIKIYEEEE